MDAEQGGGGDVLAADLFAVGGEEELVGPFGARAQNRDNIGQEFLFKRRLGRQECGWDPRILEALQGAQGGAYDFGVLIFGDELEQGFEGFGGLVFPEEFDDFEAFRERNGRGVEAVECSVSGLRKTYPESDLEQRVRRGALGPKSRDGLPESFGNVKCGMSAEAEFEACEKVVGGILRCKLFEQDGGEKEVWFGWGGCAAAEYTRGEVFDE